MAKKIPEATKSGMQHQLKDEFGSVAGLDDWSSELSNFSFDDPLDTSNRRPKSNVRRFASTMFKSTKENIGNSVLNSFFRRFPNIERAVDDTKQLITEADYIKNEFVQDIAPTTEAFKSAGRMLTNQFKDKLSDKQIKKLNKIFKEAEKGYKAPSKEETQQLAINEALGQIFVEQFKQQEEKNKEDEKNTLMSEAVESFRHGQVSQLLNQIRINSTSERLFRQSTFTSYLKKDLELKYKHLFVAKETLASVQNLAQMADSRLQAIVYNSSLPDIQKSTRFESIKQETYSIAAQNLNASVRNYFNKVLERARTSSKGLASQLNLMSSGVSMAGSMTSIPAMLAEFAGLGISNLLGEQIGSFIAGDEKGWGGKLSAYGKSLDYLAKNLPSTIANKSKQLQLEHPGSFLSFLLGTAHPENKGLINRNLAPADTVEFDQAAKNSLITIIPGYLARILQQTTNIATGTSNPLLVFDNQSNKFVTRSEFRKRAVTNLYRSLEARSSYIGDITGSFVGAYSKSRSFESSTVQKTNIDLINRYLNKVLINIEQNELTIDFNQLEKYVKSKGNPIDLNSDKPIFYRSYILTILKGINSSGKDDDLKDPLKLQVAAALLKSVTSRGRNGEEYVNRNMARVLTNKVNEFKNNYPTAINAVRRYRDSGQIGELGDLLKYDVTGSVISIDETRERKILEEYDSKYGQSSFDSAVKNIGTEEKQLEDAILELRKLSPMAYLVFNYLSGDYSAGNLAVKLLSRQFTSFAKNPLILAKALLKYSEIVNKLGIAAGKEFIRIILKYKIENKDDKDGKFLDKSFKKITDTFTRPNKNYKKLQENAEKERIAFTTSDSSTIPLDDIFGTDDTFSPSLSPTTDSKDIVKSTVDTPIVVTDKLVLEAIQQFEKTFINYTLSSPVDTSKAKSSGLLFQKKEEKKDSEVKQEDKVDELPTGTDTVFGKMSNRIKSFKESTLEDKKKQAEQAVKSAVKLAAKPETISALMSLRSKDDLMSMVLEQGVSLAVTKGGPALVNLVKDLKTVKDDPATLSDAVDKVFDTAVDGINLFQDVSQAVSSQDSLIGKGVSAAGVVGKFASDKIAERATNMYHDRVADETQQLLDTHIFSKFRKARNSILNRINREPYIDVYSKEILENTTVDPLIIASELEQGKVVFIDGKPIPDAYSIDRPVIEAGTKRTRITKAQILEGIYDVEGKEITKRSGYWHAEDKARKITEATVRGTITSLKYGIKYGAKALFFSLGMYGKMYMMLGKLGWSLAKGGIKGLFGGIKKGSYKPSAIMGTLKGIGGGFLSGIFGEKKAGEITDTLSGYKDQAKGWATDKLGSLFGKEKVSTGTIVPETPNIDKVVETNFDNDNNEATYEKPKEVTGVRYSDNDETPVDKMADGIQRIADAVDPKDGEKKEGIFSKIKNSIVLGFGAIRGLFTKGLGVLTGLGSSLSGIFSSVSTVGKLIGTIGSFLSKIPGMSGLGSALAKLLATGAGAVATGATAYAIGTQMAEDKLKEEHQELYEATQDGRLNITATDTSTYVDEDLIDGGYINLADKGMDSWGNKKQDNAQQALSEIKQSTGTNTTAPNVTNIEKATDTKQEQQLNFSYKENKYITEQGNKTLEAFNTKVKNSYNENDFKMMDPSGKNINEELKSGSLFDIYTTLIGIRAHTKLTKQFLHSVLLNLIGTYGLYKLSPSNLNDTSCENIAGLAQFRIKASTTNASPDQVQEIVNDNKLRLQFVKESTTKRFIPTYKALVNIITKQYTKWGTKERIEAFKQTDSDPKTADLIKIASILRLSTNERLIILKMLQSQVGKLDDAFIISEENFQNWYKINKEKEYSAKKAKETATVSTDTTQVNTTKEQVATGTTQSTGTSTNTPNVVNSVNNSTPEMPLANSDSIKENTNKSYAKLDEVYDLSNQAGKNNQLGKIVCPTDSNVITSPFGPRKIKKGSKNHKGIDLRAKEGDNIYAMSDGKVASIGGSYNRVVIGHLGGYITKYLHNSKILVKKGQFVKAGDIIAKAGGYGPEGPNSYDAHLHFEVIKGSTQLDPEKFLTAAGIKLVRKSEKGNTNMAPMSDAGVIEEKKDTNQSTSNSYNSELTKEVKVDTPKETQASSTVSSSKPSTGTSTLSDKASINGTSPSLSNISVSEKVTEESSMDSVTPSSNSKYIPNPDELGSLSAKFESGTQGSAAVNPNDNGKGASFGKYQINEGTGTFGEFLKYCIEKGGKNGQLVAAKLMSTSGKKRIEQWKILAKQGLIQKLEHGFIEENKYKRALRLIKDPELQSLIEQSNTLKDVLWSTAVQHGEGGASNIFNAVYKPGMSIEALVRAIYAARSKKAPSVKSRFNEELSLALSGIQKEGVKVTTPGTAGNNTGSTTSSSNLPEMPLGRHDAKVPMPSGNIQSPQVKTNPPSIANNLPEMPLPDHGNQSTNQKTSPTVKQRDPVSIIEELLTETRKQTPMLQAINDSVTNVSTTVKSSMSELAKSYGKYPSNVDKNNKQNNQVNNAVYTQMVPNPQVDVSKKTVYA